MRRQENLPGDKWKITWIGPSTIESRHENVRINFESKMKIVRVD